MMRFILVKMGKGWENDNYCDIIPDILFGVNLKDCCYTHDIDYWKKPITRKAADIRLKMCFRRKYRDAGKLILARIIPNIIYFYLRIFGWIKWINWKT